MKPIVFINYRRDDSSPESELLHKAIEEEFDDGFAFLDISDIKAGQEWPGILKETLSECEIVLVVIGKEWLTAGISDHGLRRIDNQKDWVRLEIEAAL